MRLLIEGGSGNCSSEGHFHHVPGTRVTLTVPSRSAGGQHVWSEVQENPEPPGYETGPYHGGPQPLPHGPIWCGLRLGA